MTHEEERLKILEMLENGVITVEQATLLLETVGEDEAPEEITEDMDTAELGTALEDLVVFETPFSEDDSPEFADSDMVDLSKRGVTMAVEPLPAASGAEPADEAPAPKTAGRPGSPASNMPNLNRWRRWWTIPLAAGVVITTLSAWLLFLGTANAWATFWMACLWMPLLLGIAIITLAWLSHNTPWLHVRVNTGQDEWPRRVVVSFPIPIRLAAWGLRTFGHYIPNLDATDLDDVIIALGKSLTTEDPIYIEVDNGEGGEYVEVFIG